MEDAPDMDDLLDELEADLVTKNRLENPKPRAPEPVGMMKIQKVLPHQNFNSEMRGEVTLDLSSIPKTFKPQAVISKLRFENEEKVDEVPVEVVRPQQIAQKLEEHDPEPEPVEIAIEAETIVPETVEPATDQEYDEMLEYLNGFEDAPQQVPSPEVEAPVLESDSSVGSTQELPQVDNEIDVDVREAAGKVAEDMLEQISEEILDELKLPSDDIMDEQPEFYQTEPCETSESLSPDDSAETENSDEVEAVTVIEREKVVGTPPSEVENREEQIVENVVETSQNDIPEQDESSGEVVVDSETSEEAVVEVQNDPEVNVSEEVPEVSQDHPTIETVVEDADQEEVSQFLENQNFEEDDHEVDEGEETTTSNPVNSIATVHVLNESDSDEYMEPRERRLTESELQLGKTCPYWIPDSDCPSCMLCSSKFTIINRRHHCRACGRVLCGSCCSEKSVLEYLNEAGKKNPPVRVCKPCFGMLGRIESHRVEEENRRVSSADEAVEEASSHVSSSQPPKGVLKTRPVVVAAEEDEASSSSSTAQQVVDGGEARRGVVFRDGVRPGAHAEEFDQSEQKSTALKPKKKSRKRHSVVRRCAELRMEDELACALPNSKRNTILVMNPGEEDVSMVKPTVVLDKLRNWSSVNIVLKKNLSCVMQIVEDDLFGFVWTVSTNGFAQVGLDELFFSWTLTDEEKAKLIDNQDKVENETEALALIPLAVLHRISAMYASSTENEYAGVRRVESRFSMIHSVPMAVAPLPKHILLFRPNLQNFNKFKTPSSSFLVVSFLHDDELQWATACPNRLLYRVGLKFGCYPTPIVNKTGRESVYSLETSTSVFKVLTDFRSWTYRLRYVPGCTASLTDEKTVVRIPISALKDLKDIIKSNKNMVSWRCDLSIEDDSLLVCDETSPGTYQTQVFSRKGGKRESSGVSFLILDGGSKVNSLQVSVVEDGVSIRVQSERLESILEALLKQQDVVEKSDGMEFRVEFVDDQFFNVTEFTPKSQIDDRNLMNKYQYGLSLERALTQVLQVQGISDYGIRMSHVYNMTSERLAVEEEHKIYGVIEIASRECVAMLEPFMKFLIAAGIGSISIRLFVCHEKVEYEVAPWLGLEDEYNNFKESLGQLIPILYNMMEYVTNPFEVEVVLSIVSTRPLPI